MAHVLNQLTEKLKWFLEERQKFVTVAVIDRNAKKVSFLYERRSRTRGAYIQDVCDAILLSTKQTNTSTQYNNNNNNTVFI